MLRWLAFIFWLASSVTVVVAEPLVLAHRGASGYLPEHTLAAKAVAHVQGAHYLEQDVVLTRDNVPIVLHDIYLDTITNVAEVFPDRHREDGRYYAIDFTLAEIRQLSATQRFYPDSRAAVYPNRFPVDAYNYSLHTLEEEILFIQGLNQSTGRVVGIFPEIKQTTFHQQEGKDIVKMVSDLLQQYGYGKRGDHRAMIHSFEPSTLRRLRTELGWEAPLELAFGSGLSADGSDYDWLSTAEGMREVATFADTVWAPAGHMMSWNTNGEPQLTDFMENARAAGLRVFGGVVVKESLPANCPSVDAWHQALFHVAEVDGVVTDFPDLTRQWLQENAARRIVTDLPLSHDGGRWDSGHVQGIAVDVAGGFIYYSFTNLLVKYDFAGNLIGSLQGWTGHLGDLDFNPADGKIYGSLEYKADEAFYIAVIDGARLNRTDMNAADSDIFRTVYLAEVAADYAADMDGDGVFDGNISETPDHRYGSSGIDGVSFGPAFGRNDGPQFLTVAYGIYSNLERSDNDHQVLLQYDIRDWDRYAQPLLESAPHHSGPEKLAGKYFVYTGNTTYGVQNLAYDASLQRWFMGVYQGKKPGYPNYLLFAVDALTQPVMAPLQGVYSSAGEQEQGLLLALAEDGLLDRETGIRGWNWKADVGMQPVGQGLFYLALNTRGQGWQGAELSLMRWTGDAEEPFAALAD